MVYSIAIVLASTPACLVSIACCLYFILGYCLVHASFQSYLARDDTIREIPDHATFREKENTLGWLDKLAFFLSSALCN